MNVPPELVDAALDVVRLTGVFITALFLPVLLQLGLLFAAARALEGLIAWVSPTILRLLSLIGVPLHELFHALALLLTFSGVAVVKLIIDELGTAFVSPKRNNTLGTIFTSLAPLFGGILVLWLTGIYIIPEFEMFVQEPPQLGLESAASLGTVLRESVDYLGRFVQSAYETLPDLQWQNWRTLVGFYIAISVGIGMAPSSTDLKILLGALPLTTLLILGLFTLLYLSGEAETTFATLQQYLQVPLLRFSTAVTYAFVMTSLGILVFLPLRLLQRVRGG